MWTSSSPCLQASEHLLTEALRRDVDVPEVASHTSQVSESEAESEVESADEAAVDAPPKPQRRRKRVGAEGWKRGVDHAIASGPAHRSTDVAASVQAPMRAGAWRGAIPADEDGYEVDTAPRNYREAGSHGYCSPRHQTHF